MLRPFKRETTQRENYLVARKQRIRPTDAELEILRVLWSRGPSTVREVLEALPRDAGYTTILKLLQIMAEKSLVKRDTRTQTHVYRASKPQEDTQRRLVRDLMDRAFGRSPHHLVMQALTERKASPEELKEIRRLLEELERTEE